MLRKILDSPWLYFGLAALILVVALVSQFRVHLPSRPVGSIAELARLRERDDVNVVVVSDHGMASTGPDRVIWLDEYVAEDAMDVDEMNTLLTARPAPGLEDSVHRALVRAPHLTVYRKVELPERFHLEGPRVPPIVALADEGWTISRRTAGDPAPNIILGNHGYDDALPSMGALFVARGPAFRHGVRVPAFRNIHIYPLIAAVVGIEPEESDGSLDTLRAVLVPSPVVQ